MYILRNGRAKMVLTFEEEKELIELKEASAKRVVDYQDTVERSRLKYANDLKVQAEKDKAELIRQVKERKWGSKPY